jgi:ion channel-forming bestrophin family protein
MVPYDRHQWLRPLFTLRGSILPIVMPRMLITTALAVLATLAYKAKYVNGITGSAHAVLGTTLGLVLAFRTSTAYDRFWEGRKAWGLITNRSRDLARQLVTYVVNPSITSDCGRLLCGFLHAAKRHLWRERNTPELVLLVGERQAEELELSPGPVQRCLLGISVHLKQARNMSLLTDFELMLMDKNLTELMDQFGTCQRIQRTPLPFAYVVYMRRFIVLYLASLPFALAAELGWATPVFVLISSYALYGVEEIGVQVEDPFDRSPNDIDLERIARNIERDVTALISSADDVPPSVHVSAPTVKREHLVGG